MSSLNKAMLIGRLGKDPETRYLDNGTAVSNFSIATEESFKDKSGERQTKTEWHNITLWGKLAELAESYLEKGKLVYIEGRIETRKWQDKDGNDRYTTGITGEKMQFLSSKVDTSEQGRGTAEREQEMPDEEDIPF